MDNNIQLISELNYDQALHLDDILGVNLVQRIIQINSCYKELPLSAEQKGKINSLFIKLNVFRRGPSEESYDTFKAEVEQLVAEILP